MTTKIVPTVNQCKVGSVFYSAIAYFEDNGKGHVDIDEWVVRTVQHAKLSPLEKRLGTIAPMMAYLIRRTEYTWIRKAKGKDKTMGWATKIGPHDRRCFVLGGVLPAGLFTTKCQALLDQKRFLEANIAECSLEAHNQENSVDDRVGWAVEGAENQRLLVMVKSRLTQLKK